jgi:hypothetical protein
VAADRAAGTGLRRRLAEAAASALAAVIQRPGGPG